MKFPLSRTTLVSLLMFGLAEALRNLRDGEQQVLEDPLDSKTTLRDDKVVAWNSAHATTGEVEIMSPVPVSVQCNRNGVIVTFTKAEINAAMNQGYTIDQKYTKSQCFNPPAPPLPQRKGYPHRFDAKGPGGDINLGDCTRGSVWGPPLREFPIMPAVAPDPPAVWCADFKTWEDPKAHRVFFQADNMFKEPHYCGVMVHSGNDWIICT